MDAPNLLFQYNKDSVAETYPALARRLKENPHTNTFVQALPANTENLKIVDMGCGNGQITKRLASLNPKSHVLGYDVSAQFVDMARQTEPQLDNVEFHVMDMFNMENITDKSVDLFLAVYSVHVKQTSDLIPLFQHIASKMKKGGKFKFITNTIKGKEGSSIPKAVMESRAVPLVLDKGTENPFKLVDFMCLQDEVTDALTQVGFRVCAKIEPCDRSEKMPDDYEFREEIAVIEVIIECMFK